MVAAYFALVALLALGCAERVLLAGRLADKVTAALVLIPLLLRVFQIK